MSGDRPRGNAQRLHVGVFDHLGWAIVVAVDGIEVIDRRRMPLVGADVPPAPMHHVGGPHAVHRSGDPMSDDQLRELVTAVRTSAFDTVRVGLDELVGDLAVPIATISLRVWPNEFPTDIATLRRAPYEARADPVMYRLVLAEAGRERGWGVETYDATSIEARALHLCGSEAALLTRPRSLLGPPWTKDHRLAYAAALVASLTR